MKALVCSRCGGVELKAEGDHYVCKHCGTILMPEEDERARLQDDALSEDGSAGDEKSDGNAGTTGQPGDNKQSGTERLSRTRFRIILIALGIIILALAICLGLLISLHNSNKTPASESEVDGLIEGQLEEEEPSSTPEEQSSEQIEPESAAPETVPTAVILPGDLTKEYSFQGVTFMIDPSWELEYEDWWFGAILHGLPVDQIAVIEVFVFQFGQASSLDGFLTTDNYSNMVFEQRDSWEKDGLTYRMYSADLAITGSEFFLLLCSQGQTGFAALFSMGSALQNAENYTLVDEFFHSMSFDPTQVTLDAQVEEGAFVANQR